MRWSAQRAAFRAPDWWLAGQVSGEPAQAKALDRMALNPLLDHGVTVGEGTGALLALPLVQAAAALAAELPERHGAGGERHGLTRRRGRQQPGGRSLAHLDA